MGIRWIESAVAGLVALAGCGAQEPPPEPAAPTVPTSLAAEAPAGALGDVAEPLFYDVALRVDPRAETFSGDVTMTVRLAAPADDLWLHGDDIRVTAIEIAESGGAFAPASYEEVLQSGVSRVAFGREIPAGEITLRVRYDADFDAILAGLFRVEEQGDAYALAKSESIQARRFLPSFDEPRFKTPFRIALTVPEGYVAIGNTPEIDRIAADPGFETVRFAETRPLPTYLLSIAVGPFDVVETDGLQPNAVRDETIPMRGVARRGRGGDLAYALETTPKLVEIFETAFGVPYPYQKLDIVAAPQWPSGATELAGAITYRESRILLTGADGPAARRSLLNIHSHELAHMWFGNLVTPPWWDDLWLKEAFATWGTALSLPIYEPDSGFELEATSAALGAMRLDSLASAQAVREPIARNADIRNAYNALTYSKGMAVIAMADAYFGADVFRPALGRYLTTYADGVADARQFFETIGEVTGEPALAEAFSSFIERPGVPEVSVELACSAEDGPRLRVRQARYRPLGSRIGASDPWTIPFCAAFSQGGGRGRVCRMLREREAVVPLGAEGCPDWVMPNADGAGYYRWRMTEDGWRALADAFPSLGAAEALTAVDSAVAAFESGEAAVESFLAIAEAAAASNDGQVITAPFRAFERYAALLDFDGRQAMNRYLVDLYRPRLEALARAADENGSVLRAELEVFLATVADDYDLRQALSARAARFAGFEQPRDASALTSDLYAPALSIAVQDLGRPFFDRLVTLRDELDDPRFAAASVDALAATKDLALAWDVRDLALSGVLGPRETYRLIERQMAAAETRDVTWNWLGENFNAILEQIPRQWPRRLPYLAAGYCEPEIIPGLRSLFDQKGELAPGHERALDQSIELIELCAALKDARADELAVAFIRRTGAPG